MDKTRDLLQLRSKDLGHLEALLPEGAPDVWRDFASCCFLGLLKHPHTEHLLAQELAQVAFEQLQVLVANMGGQQPYICSGARFTYKKRLQDIERDLNGRNSKEVAKKYNLSHSCILKIIKKNHESKRQNNPPPPKA